MTKHEESAKRLKRWLDTDSANPEYASYSDQFVDDLRIILNECEKNDRWEDRTGEPEFRNKIHKSAHTYAKYIAKTATEHATNIRQIIEPGRSHDTDWNKDLTALILAEQFLLKVADDITKATFEYIAQEPEDQPPASYP